MTELPALEWRKSTGRYSLGEDCWAGLIKLGSIHWGVASRGDSLPWVATTTLPGISPKGDVKYAAEADAKERVERMIRFWFSALQPKGPDQ